MILTRRQRQIVELLAEGKTFAEIGHTLGISREAVKAHIAKLALRLPGQGTSLRRVLLHAREMLAA